jgi:hypothetical protein
MIRLIEGIRETGADSVPLAFEIRHHKFRVLRSWLAEGSRRSM